MLAELSLGELSQRLSLRTPSPGGGSAAAAAGTLGAGVGAMALRYSEGTDLQDAASRLDGLREQLLALIDRDAEAYGAVERARALPKEMPEEKARRREALQAALVEATRAPIEGMKLAVEALGILGQFGPGCNANLVSDLGTAALLLEATLFGCSLNVRANLAVLRDATLVESLRGEASRLLSAGGALRRQVLEIVEKRYAGK